MRITWIAAAAVAMLAGCSTYDSVTQRIAQSITPYRITVVQGNFVSKEAASQMQVGMSRQQVRQLLGTPLLTDMFHADRWDYIFYFKRGSTSIVQQRDFIVHFTDDRVASWTGGEDLPSNLELLAEIDGDKGVKRNKPAVPVASASAPAAASAAAGSAGAAAPGTVLDTVASPSADGATRAARLPDTNPNAQAAQAANRATNQIGSPSTNSPSSAFSSAPTAAGGGIPPNGNSSGPSQFQFHRPPQQPSPDMTPSNPVGPTGADSGAVSVRGSGSTGSVPAGNTNAGSSSRPSGDASGNAGGNTGNGAGNNSNSGAGSSSGPTLNSPLTAPPNMSGTSQ